MGLRLPPGKQEAEKDLVKAAAAIDCISVMVDKLAPRLPEEELADARRLADAVGARHLEVESREGERPDYVRNDSERCWACKTELFSLCRAEADRLGLPAVVYGANVDDLGDHRPGMRAAEEAGAIAPLVDAGLGKDQVRVLSRELGLDTWDKPAFACLASRIPFGTAVTPERLARVAAAESGLRRLGLSAFRVRDHDPVARLELAEEEWERLVDAGLRAAADRACREAGFSFVAVDLRPFVSGSLSAAQLGRPAPQR